MSKQIQEAYIVAATRSPIGKSHRGYFKNTRPDDLLAAVLRNAISQVPNLDPAAIEDGWRLCSRACPRAWAASR
jgi:acetyl-CoA acyltransferase